MNQKRFACVFVAFSLAATAFAGEVQFTSGPTVKKAGGKTVIEFAVSAKTDVAVYVLDAKGKVVRHLVAGVLGDKAPAPLKPGLSQSIEWDGKDNDGNPAPNTRHPAPFKVRVALGLNPTFDRYMLYDPEAMPHRHAAAAAPNGEVYVFYLDATSNYNVNGIKIKALDINGKHTRMINPPDASLSDEQAKGLKCFRDDKGRLVPRHYNGETLSLTPGVLGRRGKYGSLYMSPAVDSKGNVHFLMHTGRKDPGARLASLDRMGGSVYDKFPGPNIFPKGDFSFSGDSSHALAVGEGDKYLYVSGLQGGGKKGGKAIPIVYRVSLANPGATQPFIKEGLKVPRGIAAHAGILYVADSGAGRVAAFNEKDGSPAGEIKVKEPRYVGVDPKTGAVYVSAAKGSRSDLIKFASLESGKEVARISIPSLKERNKLGDVGARLAVCRKDDVVKIWIPGGGRRGEGLLVPIVDKGSSLVMMAKPDEISTAKKKKRKKGGAKTEGGDEEAPDAGRVGYGIKNLWVDRRRDELYINRNRFDERTCEFKGEVVGPFGSGLQLVPDSKGNLLAASMGKKNAGLSRWTRDGKPLPWEGAKDNSSKPTGIMDMVMSFTHEVLGPWRDEVYVVVTANWRVPLGTGGAHGDKFTSINVHDINTGKLKRTAIWQVTRKARVRLDARGNIYVADCVKPRGKRWPEFFNGKLDGTGDSSAFWTQHTYGSIVKFPNEGGAIWFDKSDRNKNRRDSKPTPMYTEGAYPKKLAAKPELPMSYSPGSSKLVDGTVQGAEWVRFGFSPYGYKWGAGSSLCHCVNFSFDVDDFGRVFYPELSRFRLNMIDTSNNWLGSIGRYGNQNFEARGDDVPFAWPTLVAVSDNYAYVNDALNMRVVRIKLGYHVDRTCPVQ